MRKIALIAIATAAAVGILSALIPEPIRIAAPSATDRLKIDNQRQLKFSAVASANAHPVDLQIRNCHHEPLALTGLAQSCTCAQTNFDKMTIQPNSSSSVKIHLDLMTAFERHPWTTLDATYVVELQPMSGVKPLSQKPWKIEADVQRLLSFEQKSIHISDDLVQGQPLPIQRTRIAMAPNVGLSDVQITCDPAFASVALTQPYPRSNEAEMTITLNPSLKPGLVVFPIKATVNTTIAPSHVHYSLPVSANIQSPIAFDPPSLALGPKLVGHGEAHRVVLTHRAGLEIVQATAELTSQDIATAQSDGKNAFTINACYLKHGQQTRTIVFAIQLKGDAVPIRLPYVVKYYGVAN